MPLILSLAMMINCRRADKDQPIERPADFDVSPGVRNSHRIKC